MYALFESTPYEGSWPIAYFDTEDEATEALDFIYEFDKETHSEPIEDWDWGYFVRAVPTITADDFKAPYINILNMRKEAHEKALAKSTLGGDDCYIGRGLYSGNSDNGQYLTLSKYDYPDTYSVID